MSRGTIRGWIATHPKTASAAFTALVLLTQTQAVLAEGSGAYGG